MIKNHEILELSHTDKQPKGCRVPGYILGVYVDGHGVPSVLVHGRGPAVLEVWGLDVCYEPVKDSTHKFISRITLRYPLMTFNNFLHVCSRRSDDCCSVSFMYTLGTSRGCIHCGWMRTA